MKTQIPAVLPRGVHNNNPGNIRRTGDHWTGASMNQTDPDFVVFDHPDFGIRALAKLLLTYYDRYGLNTISTIISRWAPPSENDTGDYIRDVAHHADVTPDQVINAHDPAILTILVNAIIAHENANYRYDPAIIAAGIGLALGKTEEASHVAV